MIHNLKTYVTENTIGIIIFFILKIFILFFLFDLTFQFLIGAPVKGGIYVPFLEKYNVAEWYRDFLLYGGGKLVGLWGYDYTIDGKVLSISGGSGVIMGYSCYGFSLISMFMALIIAYPKNPHLKIYYLVIGVAIILLLNMIRTGGLAIAYTQMAHQSIRDIDHHMVFNVIVYLFIFGIFYLFVNKKGPTGN
jgi:exosortase/archaeosortase family protein